MWKKFFFKIGFLRDGRMLNLSERFKRIQMIMSQRDDTDRFYLTLFNNFSSTLKLTNAQVCS